MSATVIQLIGGDLRQLTLASRLAATGLSVQISGISPALPVISRYFPALKPLIREDPREYSRDCRVCLLPLPISADALTVHCPLCTLPDAALPLTALLESLPAGTRVFGGRVSAFLRQLAMESNRALTDYYASESVMIRNAVPTAEGAVQIAMQQLPVTISGSHCVVLGCGRVGKILALTLRHLNADVTVCARNPADRSYAIAEGCRAAVLDDYLANPCPATVIFNTIPVRLLDETFFGKLSGAPPLIDLASVSCCDRLVAEKYGITVTEARSLPGKTAPLTAGAILADAVLELLSQEGLL